MKSLQDLSNNHKYQHIEMVNAPAGGGRQAQPGVATGQSVLAWRLGYAEVFYTLYRSRSYGIFT
ncbi:hypothetical protein [Planktomarina sp.]|uniref:hypothetical protein n=1 Tax=Planktomarina sp. TaxID=2024851 RepID=UPI00326090DF